MSPIAFARLRAAAAPAGTVRRAPAPHAEYRWTKEKARAFLHCMAEGHSVAEAARRVGMSRQSAYRLRARADNVARAWKFALDLGAKARAPKLARRGAEAVQGNVFRAAKVTDFAPQGDGFPAKVTNLPPRVTDSRPKVTQLPLDSVTCVNTPRPGGARS